MQGNHDDSDGDTASIASSLAINDWPAIVTEKEHNNRDAEISSDEAYPLAFGMIVPEFPPRQTAGRHSSIEIDEDEEDEGRRKSF